MTEPEETRCGACRCLIDSSKIKFCRICGTVLCPICVALPGEGTIRPLCWGCYMKALTEDPEDD